LRILQFHLRRLIAHNAFMPLPGALRPAFRLRLLPVVLCALLQLSTSAAAKTPPAPALGSGYAPALAAADHFLQAWQSGDVENGTVLLSSHAKDAATTEGVEKFFSNRELSAYEIGRGKLLKRGRYEFPVVLVGGADPRAHFRRRFSTIIVVNTGNNEWAVDKLP
jgi:hypothetical protein